MVSLRKAIFKLLKIRTDKDFAIIFFFEKPKNLCAFQKLVFKEVLENMKKYFFPPLCTVCLENVRKPLVFSRFQGI